MSDSLHANLLKESDILKTNQNEGPLVAESKKNQPLKEIQKALTFTKVQNSFFIPASFSRWIFGKSRTFFVGFLFKNLIISITSNKIKARCLDSGTKEFSSRIYGYQMICASLDTNKYYIATGSSDSVVRIWNYYAKEIIATLNGHKDRIKLICFSLDGLYLASSSNSEIIIWDVEAQTNLWKYNNEVDALCWSPDSKFLVTSSKHGLIDFLNVNEKKSDLCFKGHENNAFTVAFSLDGKFLVSGSRDKSVLIWDVLEKKIEHRITEISFSVNVICISPDNTILAIGLSNYTISLWDFKEKAFMCSLNGHSKLILCLNFNEDMSLLASCCEWSIRFWRIKSKRSGQRIYENFRKKVTCMCISQNGEYLSLGCYENTVNLWNLKTQQETILEGHKNRVNTVCFSPDNKLLASGSYDQSFIIWDIVEKKELWRNYTKFNINSLAFSPDGKILASASNQIAFWNMADKTNLWLYDMSYHKIYCISFSPDGRLFASASDDKTIKIFDVQKKKEKNNFIGHIDSLAYVCFSPDSMFLASGDMDGGLKLWSIAEKKNIWSFRTVNRIISMNFSIDGKFLVTGNANGDIRMWNLLLKKEEVFNALKNNDLEGILFTPDGKSLITGNDWIIMMWNFKDYTEELKIPSKRNNYKRITFSEDNYTVYAHYEPFLIVGYNYKDGAETVVDDANTPFFIPIEDGGIVFDPLSCYSSGLHNKLEYHCSFYNFQNQDYEKIKDPNITISNLKFTIAHFLAFLGHKDYLQNYTQNSKLCLCADAFGHSPLYYSIKQQHREVTDLLVNYLSEIAQLEDFGVLKYTTLKSIEKDLTEIIKSSSSQLDSFFAHALLFQNKVIDFGCPLEDLPMMFTSNFTFSIESEFLLEKGPEIPLVFKHSAFCIPTVTGSQASLELLSAITSCENKDIYRTEFIQCIIKKKWDEIHNWVYFYTFILWANLVFLCLFLVSKSLGFFIIVMIVNVVLLSWEVLQAIMSGQSYFADVVNFIDIIRFLTTAIFGILVLFDIEEASFTWIMLAFNLIRGISGFTAFDSTRYYIKLLTVSIYEMKDFLYIFIYTTIALGLLNMIAGNKNELSYESLWDSSFNLVVGNSDMFFNTSYIQNITFLLAVTINMIIMLNMIISILGDVFDEFQLGSEIFNYSEMIQVILEIEQILSIKNRQNEFKYIQTCMNAYEQVGSDWKGKVMDIRDFMEDKFMKKTLKPALDENAKSVKICIDRVNQKFVDNFKAVDGKFVAMEKRVDEKIMNLEGKLLGKIEENAKALEENTKVLEENAKALEEKFTAEFRGVEGKMNEIKDKIDLILNLISKSN
ncbi:hypothetical protein SteCoe_600 [Stentor coeruleus]|uniref:Intraflagellar transport protein 122 homolog n=1 Tax=Stentor coeruleus TaxID=5963 RepID=A0A1R2D3N6_9CILI|nr:hypothetical protein SteCoe_600 [Stentor coeruleus]